MNCNKLLGLCFSTLIVIVVFLNGSADAVMMAKKSINMQPVSRHSVTRQKHQTKEVPKQFEITSDDHAVETFQKYIRDISKMNPRSNVTYLYKIKVEPQKTYKTTIKKKSKKYQVPLKKQSMHLSTHELVMKRMVEEKEKEQTSEPKKKQVNVNVSATTEVEEVSTTRSPHALKYKPVLNKIHRIKKSKFGSKPVKSMVSTFVSKV
ncbi:hypothetical protein JYU34_004677 [Plutella xylostella]|uniref:Uncharacterized protein n=1 Tax=Plutella xylostella TaxID=51655 RepID=A0ABQ7QYK8_PLUXY|nr:hypothetical protein JYU34_004677 [Plutella xylostella]